MPNLKKKSDSNSEAAQQLINQGYYTSSVHCSYYSVLQLMKHILKNKFKIEYPDQYPRGLSTGSHEYVLKLIKQEINSPADRRDFERYFEFLKQERTKSDYEIELFDVKKSLDVKEGADRLRKKLLSVFK